MVFDDSLDHETWNRTEHTRVVFGIDFWHPALTQPERDFLQGTYRSADSPLSRHVRRYNAHVASGIAT